MEGGSLWRKACALAFVMDFGGGLLSVAVPMLAVSLDAKAEIVGIVGSVSLIGYTLFCFLAQPLTDRWGRRTSMLLGSSGVAGLCIAFVVVALIQSIWLLSIVAFFIGVTYAFFWPPAQATAGADVPSSQLLSVLRAYNLSWSGGRMLGTGLSGILFEQHPVLPFVLAAILSMAVAISVALLKLPNIVAPPNHDDDVDDSDGSSNPLVVSAQLGNFVRSFAVIEAIVLFPKLGKDWNWTEGQVSGLLFCIFVGHLIAFVTAPFIIRNVGWQWVVGVKVGVGSLAALLGFLPSQVVLAIALLALGIAGGLATVVSLYLSITTQGRSVKGSARHEAGVGGGGVAGPILGGFVMGHWSHQAAFMLPAAVVLTLLFWDAMTLRSKVQT